MLHVPFRGGVRGGKDQFTWDSVKTDKVLIFSFKPNKPINLISKISRIENVI
jgi:hypothetical protein